MKIWEIDWVNGNKYIIDGEIWRVDGYDLVNECGDRLGDVHKLYLNLNLDLEEYVDWSKVEVDTKILASIDGEEWYKAHFAKYEDETFYTFSSGRTSYTKVGLVSWKYAKLADK